MRSDTQTRKRHYAVGPNGDALTIDDLPSRDTKRWVPRIKAELVNAVRGGLLSLDEVCGRYGLTPEEFCAWQHAWEQLGMKGLRATKPQDYRHSGNRRSIGCRMYVNRSTPSRLVGCNGW